MAKVDPFELAAEQEGMSGVPLALARSIYMQESGGGKNTKTSNAGAVGGMQVMPATFAGLADKGWDNNNPVHNARAGMRLIKQLHASNGGNAGLTAVGYYGGPGAMNKAKNGEAVSDPRNPDAPDTIRYSDEVLSRMPDNGAYARVVRTPAATAYPIPAAPPSDGMPTEIPAYHGKPDEWSKFGRALPSTPVQPTDMNYGKQVMAPDTPAPVLTPYEADPQMLARYMPKSNQANMQAFQGWGSPL
jgi:hypothetical protein